MRRPIGALLATTVGVLAAACGESPITGPITGLPRQLSVAEQRLVEADNRFAFKLFREVVGREDRDKNVFISPLSVAMALGMTYNGAAGSTQEAMQRTLELGGMTLEEVNGSYRSLIDLLRGLDPRVQFQLANSIWYRQDLTPRQEFLDVNLRYFDARVSALDFGAPTAARTINEWVSQQTRGKITEIVDSPIPYSVIMYLINAIYFKGDWAYQFDRDLTRDAPFRLADGSTATVKMMSTGDEVRVTSFSDRDVVVLDLPYGGRAYSMTIVVPQEPAGIDSLVAGLTQERWNAWIARLDSTSLFVSMPKFTLTYELLMNNALSALGMFIAFQPQVADFTRMYALPPGVVYISKVKHKTFVDVNEAGTEAAAVTSVEMRLVSAPPAIVIDRPFVFAIREKYSGTILFMGRMMNPAAR